LEALPAATARRRPALTRSWITARFNAVNTPMIWNRAVHAGVVVSTACWRKNRLHALAVDRGQEAVEALQ
jgi:hypothetical protein